MDKSKFFKEGKLINFKISATHVTFYNYEILEVQPAGLVVQKAGAPDAPTLFYPLNYFSEIEFVKAKKAVANETTGT